MIEDACWCRHELDDHRGGECRRCLPWARLVQARHAYRPHHLLPLVPRMPLVRRRA